MVTALRMMGLAALYYLFQFIIRVSSGVISQDLMHDFCIDAAGVGFVVAIATYFYGLLQIPCGLLVDRWGPKRALLLSVTLCSVGVTLFAMTSSLYMAYFARLLIGAGSASGFLLVNRVGLTWLPKDKTSLVFALTMMAGTGGAYLGGPMLATLHNNFHWRDLLLGLAGVGAVVFVLNLLFLKDKTETSSNSGSPEGPWAIIKQISRNQYLWRYAIIAIGAYAPMTVIGDLWGIPFVVSLCEVPHLAASQTLVFLYSGLFLGSIVIAKISDYFGNRQYAIFGSLLLTLGVILALAFTMPSLFVTHVLFFLLGFSMGGELLCFAVACESVPLYMAATVIGFINMLVTLGGAALQNLTGYLLRLCWQGTLHGDTPFYCADEYQLSLWPLIAITVISCVVSLRTPDPAKNR